MRHAQGNSGGVALKLIGVIDLLGGHAVHARGGCRHGYRPLAHVGKRRMDGDAPRLAGWYRELGVDEIYVADLDAIAGGAEQDHAVREIAETGVTLWLDAGSSTPAQALRAAGRGADCVVVGLETLASFDALEVICDAVAPTRCAFSLDLRDGRPIIANEALRHLSPAALVATATEKGAESVIVLDLARVGSGRGPDLAIVEDVRRAIPSVPLMVGGGIRGTDDLRRVAAAGADGVLVATALHASGGADLVAYARSRQNLTRR